VNDTSSELLDSMFVNQLASRIVLLNNISLAICGAFLYGYRIPVISIWNFKTKAQILKIQIKISDPSMRPCEWTLAKIKDELLASGGDDATIKIWNFTNGHQIKNMTGHTRKVYDLVCYKVDLLISCSADRTIRFWNATSGCFFKALTDHTDAITCIRLLSIDVLLSGSTDLTNRFWNLTTFRCKKTLDEQVKSAYCFLLLDNGQLASGGPDQVIQMWNIDKDLLVFELAGHTDTVFSLVGQWLF
jgi:WD40 repeat protein